MSTIFSEAAGRELFDRCLVCAIWKVYPLGTDENDPNRERIEQLMDLFRRRSRAAGLHALGEYRVLRGA